MKPRNFPNEINNRRINALEKLLAIPEQDRKRWQDAEIRILQGRIVDNARTVRTKKERRQQQAPSGRGQ